LREEKGIPNETINTLAIHSIIEPLRVIQPASSNEKQHRDNPYIQIADEIEHCLNDFEVHHTKPIIGLSIN